MPRASLPAFPASGGQRHVPPSTSNPTSTPQSLRLRVSQLCGCVGLPPRQPSSNRQSHTSSNSILLAAVRLLPMSLWACRPLRQHILKYYGTYRLPDFPVSGSTYADIFHRHQAVSYAVLCRLQRDKWHLRSQPKLPSPISTRLRPSDSLPVRAISFKFSSSSPSRIATQP